MQQVIQTINHPIHAKVTIPGSKSMTNRALLLAALADGVSEIYNLLISDDTLVFIQALQKLGILVQLDAAAQTCIIGGGSGQMPRKEASIWCGDAGTAARFLLAACAASPGVYQFDASEQLRQRPIAGLLQTLNILGARIHPQNTEQMPLTLTGTDGLNGGELEIDASETGQFISALLMIAPFAKKNITINTKEIVSRPYIDMTCAMMADFGVLVHRMHKTRFSIPVPQIYKSRDYIIEPDFSTASYFFAAAAVTGGKVSIQAVARETSKQGDSRFLSVLEKMGCKVSLDEKHLSVLGPKELQGVNVDMRDFSDTFMTLAAIAPYAVTPTAITNIGHARNKESDRIKVMRMELEKMGVKVEEGSDWLKIYPSVPKGAVINSHQDHRIAMSFAVMGLRTPDVVIDGAECVSKTCPEFFTLWASLSH